MRKLAQTSTVIKKNIYIYTKNLKVRGFFMLFSFSFSFFSLFFVKVYGLRFRTKNTWGSIADKITFIYIYIKLESSGFFHAIFLFSVFVKVYGFKVYEK